MYVWQVCIVFSMYVYKSMPIHTCTCISIMHIGKHICVSPCIYICMFQLVGTSMFGYMYSCAYIHTHTLRPVHMFLCVLYLHKCIHVSKYVYIYMQLLLLCFCVYKCLLLLICVNVCVGTRTSIHGYGHILVYAPMCFLYAYSFVPSMHVLVNIFMQTVVCVQENTYFYTHLCGCVYMWI